MHVRHRNLFNFFDNALHTVQKCFSNWLKKQPDLAKLPSGNSIKIVADPQPYISLLDRYCFYNVQGSTEVFQEIKEQQQSRPQQLTFSRHNIRAIPHSGEYFHTVTHRATNGQTDAALLHLIASSAIIRRCTQACTKSRCNSQNVLSKGGEIWNVMKWGGPFLKNRPLFTSSNVIHLWL